MPISSGDHEEATRLIRTAFKLAPAQFVWCWQVFRIVEHLPTMNTKNIANVVHNVFGICSTQDTDGEHNGKAYVGLMTCVNPEVPNHEKVYCTVCTSRALA